MCVCLSVCLSRCVHVSAILFVHDSDHGFCPSSSDLECRSHT